MLLDFIAKKLPGEIGAIAKNRTRQFRVLDERSGENKKTRPNRTDLAAFEF